jgi:hypothetical protein
VHAFDQEMVVDAVACRVVALVMQRHLPERHVADDDIHRALGDARVRERLGANIRLRIEVTRDRGRDRVQLDADALSPFRRCADERAATAPRLEHDTVLKPKRGDRAPGRRGISGIGVMRV